MAGRSRESFNPGQIDLPFQSLGRAVDSITGAGARHPDAIHPERFGLGGVSPASHEDLMAMLPKEITEPRYLSEARDLLKLRFREIFEEDPCIVKTKIFKNPDGSPRNWHFWISNLPVSWKFPGGPVVVFPDGKIQGIPVEYDLSQEAN